MNRLIGFSKKYFLNIIITVLASILSSMATVWIIDIARTIIDLSIAGEINNISFYIIKILIYIVLGMVSGYIVIHQTTYFGANVLKDIRVECTSHLLKLPPNFLDENDFGDIYSKLSNETGIISDYLSQYFKDCIAQPIMLVIYSFYLFSINKTLAIICLVPIFVIIPVYTAIVNPIKKAQKVYVEKLATTNNNILEVFNGIRVVKSYNIEDTLSAKYDERLENVVNIAKNIDKKEYSSLPLNVIMVELPTLLALTLGGYYVFQGQLTLGILVAFTGILGKLAGPLSFSFQLYIRTKMALISAKRVFSILDYPIEETFENNSENHTKSNTVFDIQNLSFTYSKSTSPSVDNINLLINKGEKVAFVGHSGSGKSTILKLLYKHYDFIEGDIKFYGTSFHKISPLFLRDNISLISQEPFLFPLTIFDNIKLGNKEATYDEVIVASKLANCHDFIIGLKDGYDTEVGEKGAFLSGGQRQRLSIARAFLKNSDVILLDEPTSALDKESETLVNEALSKIGENKTIVAVSHRMDTIINYDKIVVLNSGKIEAIGIHSELMESSQLYNGLYTEYSKEDDNYDK